jgi:hypothetical protein
MRRHWHIGALLIVLTGLVTLTLAPYQGNLSALFHIDRSIADSYAMPPGTVVLSMPGYDGMEYFQMARNMPTILSPADWGSIDDLPPGPYAHQRFLLPFLAFGLSLGNDTALPYAFLLINVLSIIGTAVVMTTIARGKKFYPLCIALCPAAMVGLHFMLAEPLNLFLITLFLWRYSREEKVDPINTLLLTLAVLTREVNILFVLGTLAYTVVRGRWRDVKAFVLPVGAFIALHALIYAIFNQIPFLWSAEKNALPLVAIWELLSGQKGYSVYTLSSIALFLGFVLPAFVRTGMDIVSRKRIEFVPLMLMAFLTLMLLMPDHIWGSITSIGRVITPVYPLFFAYAAQRDGWIDRTLAVSIGMIGLAAGIGLALIPHPFTLA